MNLDRMARGLLPFAAAALLAWIVVPIGSSIAWWQYAGSVVLLGLAGLLTSTRLPGHARPGLGAVVDSYVFLAAVALLRNSAGGINSAVAGLSLIPVFCTALYSRSRRELGLVLLGVAIFYLAPIVIVGTPSYPETQYRAALLSVMVATIVGLATQHLVAAVRHEARKARERERMLGQIGHAVRELLDSSHARHDLCEAARTISDATSAVLYEPVPGTRTLRSTAMAGLDLPTIEIPPDRASALADAFIAGRSYLLTGDKEDRLASRVAWEASGRPESILYEPLLRDGETVGVLVVGWPETMRVDGPRATVVALLAQQAAAVIDRADAIDMLAGQAQTDALTGLPNRRIWDERIATAVTDDREFTIAMLDLDHFKQFNDSCGHQAGDRLLKETSAGWRDQLRGGDLLARLGGEEFGLLLLDADLETAKLVVERLRSQVTHERTCSAGIAVRRPDESYESVIGRADQALYEAKRAGRDRACISG